MAGYDDNPIFRDGDSEYNTDRRSPFLRSPQATTRIRGIDTPELGKNGRPDQPVARTATDAANHLARNGFTNREFHGYDTHGRPLVSRSDNEGNSFGYEMIAGGFANPTGFSTETEKQAPYAEAARKLLGIEGPMDNDATWQAMRERARQERASMLLAGMNKDSENATLFGTPTRTTSDGAFGRAIDRGIDNTKASLYAFVNAIGGATGIDPLAKWGEEGMKDRMWDAMKNPAHIGRYDDIDGLADFFTYAAETIGEELPGVGADILAGLAGGGVGGVVARRSAAAAGKSVLRKMGVPSTPDNVKKTMLSMSGVRLGAFGSMYGQQVGQTQMRLLEEDLDEPWTALGAGAVKAASEYAVSAGILRSMGMGGILDNLGEGAKRFKGGVAKRAAKGAAGAASVSAPLEGATEAVDYLIDEMAVGLHKDDHQILATEEDHKNFMDAMLRGALFGGSLSGAGGAINHAMRGEETTGNPTGGNVSTDTPDTEMPDVAGEVYNEQTQGAPLSQSTTSEPITDPAAGGLGPDVEKAIEENDPEPEPVSQLRAQAQTLGFSYIPPSNGDAVAELTEDGEFTYHEGTNGGGFILRPDFRPTSEIEAAIEDTTDETVGRALNFSEDKTTVAEAAQQGDPVVAVETKDQDGTVIKQELTNASKAEAVQAKWQEQLPDFDTTITTQPEELLTERAEAVEREAAETSIPEATRKKEPLVDHGPTQPAEPADLQPPSGDQPNPAMQAAKPVITKRGQKVTPQRARQLALNLSAHQQIETDEVDEAGTTQLTSVADYLGMNTGKMEKGRAEKVRQKIKSLTDEEVVDLVSRLPGEEAQFAEPKLNTPVPALAAGREAYAKNRLASAIVGKTRDRQLRNKAFEGRASTQLGEVLEDHLEPETAAKLNKQIQQDSSVDSRPVEEQITTALQEDMSWQQMYDLATALGVKPWRMKSGNGKKATKLFDVTNDPDQGADILTPQQEGTGLRNTTRTEADKEVLKKYDIDLDLPQESEVEEQAAGAIDTDDPEALIRLVAETNDASEEARGDRAVEQYKKATGVLQAVNNIGAVTPALVETALEQSGVSKAIDAAAAKMVDPEGKIAKAREALDAINNSMAQPTAAIKNDLEQITRIVGEAEQAKDKARQKIVSTIQKRVAQQPANKTVADFVSKRVANMMNSRNDKFSYTPEEARQTLVASLVSTDLREQQQAMEVLSRAFGVAPTEGGSKGIHPDQLNALTKTIEAQVDKYGTYESEEQGLGWQANYTAHAPGQPAGGAQTRSEQESSDSIFSRALNVMRARMPSAKKINKRFARKPNDADPLADHTKVFLDFETYYDNDGYDLGSMGQDYDAYTNDDRFEAQMMSIKIGDGETELVVGQDAIKSRLEQLKGMGGKKAFVAHNADFDMAVMKRLGVEPSKDDRVVDTVRLARAYDPDQKSYRLGDVIQRVLPNDPRMVKDNKALERVAGKRLADIPAEDMEALKRYAINDTAAMAKVFEVMNPSQYALDSTANEMQPENVLARVQGGRPSDPTKVKDWLKTGIKYLNEYMSFGAGDVASARTAPTVAPAHWQKLAELEDPNDPSARPARNMIVLQGELAFLREGGYQPTKSDLQVMDAMGLASYEGQERVGVARPNSAAAFGRNFLANLSRLATNTDPDPGAGILGVYRNVSPLLDTIPNDTVLGISEGNHIVTLGEAMQALFGETKADSLVEKATVAQGEIEILKHRLEDVRTTLVEDGEDGLPGLADIATNPDASMKERADALFLHNALARPLMLDELDPSTLVEFEAPALTPEPEVELTDPAAIEAQQEYEVFMANDPFPDAERLRLFDTANSQLKAGEINRSEYSKAVSDLKESKKELLAESNKWREDNATEIERLEDAARDAYEKDPSVQEAKRVRKENQALIRANEEAHATKIQALKDAHPVRGMSIPSAMAERLGLATNDASDLVSYLWDTANKMFEHADTLRRYSYAARDSLSSSKRDRNLDTDLAAFMEETALSILRHESGLGGKEFEPSKDLRSVYTVRKPGGPTQYAYSKNEAEKLAGADGTYAMGDRLDSMLAEMDQAQRHEFRERVEFSDFYSVNQLEHQYSGYEGQDPDRRKEMDPPSQPSFNDPLENTDGQFTGNTTTEGLERSNLDEQTGDYEQDFGATENAAREGEQLDQDAPEDLTEVGAPFWSSETHTIDGWIEENGVMTEEQIALGEHNDVVRYLKEGRKFFIEEAVRSHFDGDAPMDAMDYWNMGQVVGDEDNGFTRGWDNLPEELSSLAEQFKHIDSAYMRAHKIQREHDLSLGINRELIITPGDYRKPKAILVPDQEAAQLKQQQLNLDALRDTLVKRAATLFRKGSAAERTGEKKAYSTTSEEVSDEEGTPYIRTQIDFDTATDAPTVDETTQRFEAWATTENEFFDPDSTNPFFMDKGIKLDGTVVDQMMHGMAEDLGANDIPFVFVDGSKDPNTAIRDMGFDGDIVTQSEALAAVEGGNKFWFVRSGSIMVVGVDPNTTLAMPKQNTGVEKAYQLLGDYHKVAHEVGHAYAEIELARYDVGTDTATNRLMEMYFKERRAEAALDNATLDGFTEWFADQAANHATFRLTEMKDAASSIKGGAFDKVRDFFATAFDSLYDRNEARFAFSDAFNRFRRLRQSGMMDDTGGRNYSLKAGTFKGRDARVRRYDGGQTPMQKTITARAVMKAVTERGKASWNNGLLSVGRMGFTDTRARIAHYSEDLASMLAQRPNSEGRSDGRSWQTRQQTLTEQLGGLWSTLSASIERTNMLTGSLKSRKKVEQAISDYNNGVKNEHSEVVAQFVNKAFSAAQKAGLKTLTKDEVTLTAMDHTEIDKRRGEFKQVLEENGYEPQPGTTLDDTVDGIMNGTGFAEFQLNPGRPIGMHATTSQMFRNKKLRKALEDAGFLAAENEVVLHHWMTGIARRAAWEGTFGDYTKEPPAGMRPSDYRHILIGESDPYGKKTTARGLERDGQFFTVNAKMTEALTKIAKERGPAARDELVRLLDHAAGRTYMELPRGFRVAQEGVMAYTMSLTLAFAGIASIPELGMSMARAQLPLGRILEALKGAKEGHAIAHALGIAAADVAERSAYMMSGEGFQGSLASKGLHVFFKATGLQAITNASRAIGVSMGRQAIQYWAEKGDNESLKRLHLTPEQVAAWNQLTDGGKNMRYWHDTSGLNEADAGAVKAMNDAISQFVDESTAIPNKMQAPGWMNNPWLATFAMVKRFFWSMADVVVGGLWRQGQRIWKTHGDKNAVERAIRAAFPALVAGTVLVGLGAITDWLRRYIRQLNSGYIPEQSQLEGVQAAIGRSGIGGPLDMALAIKQQQEWGTSVLGSSNMVLSHAERMLDFGRDGELSQQEMLTKLRQSIPVFSQNPGLWNVLAE